MLRRDETAFELTAAGPAALALLVALEAVGRFALPSLAVIVLIVQAFRSAPVRRPIRLAIRTTLASAAVLSAGHSLRASAALVGHTAGLSPSVQMWVGLLSASLAAALIVGLDWTVLKARAVALLPRPDPNFDPFSAAHEPAQPVREMLLHSGPTPASGYRPLFGEPAELSWG